MPIQFSRPLDINHGVYIELSKGGLDGGPTLQSTMVPCSSRDLWQGCNWS
jgi:hypothetical protein